jgi:pimeloyl-ACP methyl ester carboxylesterase
MPPTLKAPTMAHPGTLHLYTTRLFAFEHSPSHSTPPTNPPNTLLWVGGLGDGILTVHYTQAIARSLPANWVLAEVLLSSSYKGWALGSLKRDARELGQCVKYFKTLRPGARIVLMGHSTGCQDLMEYLVGEGKAEREGVDGAILQAGVSDREAWDDMASSDEDMRKSLEELVAKAKEWIDEGRGMEVLPRMDNPVSEMLGAPCTAYRTWSLLAKGGDDDYFSADLGDEALDRTFGVVGKGCSMMFLWGGEDPYVPKKVNKEGLLRRWTEAVRRGGGMVDDVCGGVVEGAHHNLNDDGEEVVKDLVGRVVRFLKGVGGEGSGSRL